jgi:hypothetical protein
MVGIRNKLLTFPQLPLDASTCPRLPLQILPARINQRHAMGEDAEDAYSGGRCYRT